MHRTIQKRRKRETKGCLTPAPSLFRVLRKKVVFVKSRSTANSALVSKYATPAPTMVAVVELMLFDSNTVLVILTAVRRGQTGCIFFICTNGQETEAGSGGELHQIAQGLPKRPDGTIV